MIIIEKTFGTISDSDGVRNYSEPSRNLTPEEKQTVIAQWGDELNVWYFQKEDVENLITEWVQYQDKVMNNNIDVDGDGIISYSEKTSFLSKLNPFNWFK